jgi:hypothetical protein
LASNCEPIAVLCKFRFLAGSGYNRDVFFSSQSVLIIDLLLLAVSSLSFEQTGIFATKHRFLSIVSEMGLT